MFKKQLRIFKVNEYHWVVARSREEAIKWYSNWYKNEVDDFEPYDQNECEEINYNEKFWHDLGDKKQRQRKAKWFLKKKNLPKNTEIPGIIFSTEY